MKRREVMKVWIGDKKEEKKRLIDLGVNPAVICLNNDIYFTGIPGEKILNPLGLRLPTSREARYIGKILELVQGIKNPHVWAFDEDETPWAFPWAFSVYKAIGDEEYEVLRSHSHARLVLLERED